jgi:hypothetical protein
VMQRLQEFEPAIEEVQPPALPDRAGRRSD